MKIEKLFLTKENLLKIEKIDDAFYKNDITGINWYLERYNPNHFAYCLIDNDDVVGYIVYVPIKKELYDAIINGVLLNDVDINPTMFLDKSDYYYIVSCVLKEEYKHKNYGKLLMEKVLSDLEGNYACCLTVSEAGYRLASRYMNLKNKLNSDIAVFENVL